MEAPKGGWHWRRVRPSNARSPGPKRGLKRASVPWSALPLGPIFFSIVAVLALQQSSSTYFLAGFPLASHSRRSLLPCVVGAVSTVLRSGGLPKGGYAGLMATLTTGNREPSSRSRPLRIGWILIFGLPVACGGETGLRLVERSAPLPRSATDTPGHFVEDAGVTSSVEPPEPRPTMDTVEPEPFVEKTECPDTPPRAVRYDCDPWAEQSGCGPSEACYPLVDYPNGPCEVERFGAECRPAGAGSHGEACDARGCAAGHVCVSTRRGTYCSQTCAFNTGVPSGCPAGLLCQPIDIDGFGACL